MKKLYTLLSAVALCAGVAAAEDFGGTVYEGTVVIDLFGEVSDPIAANVHIIANEDNPALCTLALPNFSLGEGATVGDIVVPNVSKTVNAEGNGYDYEGSVDGLVLNMEGMGEIVANVKVTGTTDAEGNASFDIPVLWIADPTNPTEGVTIGVTFNGATETPDVPAPPVEFGGIVYKGTVVIDLLGEVSDPIEANVHIIANEDNPALCTLALPNFSLGEGATVGDIVVPNVSKTVNAEGNGYDYEGSVDGLVLNMEGMGEIVANVKVTGTTDAEGNASLDIPVLWIMDPANPTEGITIGVTFNGTTETPDVPAPPVEFGGIVYEGAVVIDLLGEVSDPIAANVHIIANEDNPALCTLALPNFSLGEGATVGDIVVPNVSKTVNAQGNGYDYEGSVDGLVLNMQGMGEIVANVKVTGTTDAEGNASFDIPVLWIMDPTNPTEGITIGVTFNGATDTPDVPVGLTEICIDNNAPVEYFNLQGVRIANPAAGSLVIRRQGGKANKVLVK